MNTKPMLFDETLAEMLKKQQQIIRDYSGNLQYSENIRIVEEREG